jgi:hypothetical protein
VKGRGGGKADVLWQVMCSLQRGTSPDSIEHFGSRTAHTNSIIGYYTNVPASSIYNDLTINDGEIKILLEVSLIYFYGKTDYGFSDGRSCRNVTPREAFGFWMLSPRHKTAYDKTLDSGATYFNTVVIFTPKPGLFDETLPT